MATLAEVDRALRGLAERLAALDPEVRARHVQERTVACTVADLQVVYWARVSAEGLVGITTTPPDRGQVRLEVASDDLVALTEGRLKPAAAWASGRLRVDANVLDLLRLRSLL